MLSALPRHVSTVVKPEARAQKNQQKNRRCDEPFLPRLNKFKFSPGDNKNIKVEWVVKVSDKEIITIYNYKSSQCYSNELPAIADVADWHIGGGDVSAIDKIVGLMADRARITFRPE